MLKTEDFFGAAYAAYFFFFFFLGVGGSDSLIFSSVDISEAHRAGEQGHFLKGSYHKLYKNN